MVEFFGMILGWILEIFGWLAVEYGWRILLPLFVGFLICLSGVVTLGSFAFWVVMVICLAIGIAWHHRAN